MPVAPSQRMQMTVGVRIHAALMSMAALTAAAVVPGPANASRGGCVVAKGGKVVAQNSYGLVYVRGGRFFGCSSARGKVKALPQQGTLKVRYNGEVKTGSSVVESGPATAGRYVAYGVHWTSSEGGGGAAGPSQTARVIVFDLSAGKTKHAPKPDDGPAPYIQDLVVKANGSVAWMAQSGAGALAPTRSLMKFDTASGAATRLDADDGEYGPHRIEQGSLALSIDGSRVYWTAYDRSESDPLYLSAPFH
ncbi:MAG: hypothetical protein QOJ07_2251 [Thermoleophilaceae bacterium]|nr:hypothetical protein [Thermoleophilaceae bacterium]